MEKGSHPTSTPINQVSSPKTCDHPSSRTDTTYSSTQTDSLPESWPAHTRKSKSASAATTLDLAKPKDTSWTKRFMLDFAEQLAKTIAMMIHMAISMWFMNCMSRYLDIGPVAEHARQQRRFTEVLTGYQEALNEVRRGCETWRTARQ